MITRITKANADKYRLLFEDAVFALQTHDDSGKPVTENGKPIIPIPTEKIYQPVDINIDTYKPGFHYINNEGNWVLTAPLDVFSPEAEYAIAIGVYYQPVKITAEDYEPGFHYIKNGEDWILTTYADAFSPEAEYAIAIESGKEITTLEEYFCYIADLRRINKKFTILPLPGKIDEDGKKDGDEEFFIIDANSRTITVPEIFVTNGVSVQGDEIAEMLYFKIDRYFDMTDLGEKNVYIEWTLPVDPKTGERKSGVSIPDIVDTEVVPGYVIIGWPIRSELTQIPGKIDFAVRFYEIPDEGDYATQVIYSFSTKAASVEIKPSLNLNIREISLDGSALNSEDLINSRLENSISKDDTTQDPETPHWHTHYFLNLPQEAELIEDDGNALYDTYKIYLTDKTTGKEVNNGTFIVEAYVQDGGRLSYNWIKRNQDGEVILDYDNGDGNTFVEVRDYNETLSYIKYYQEADEFGNHAEFKFTESIPNLAAAKAAGLKVFVRVAKIIMNGEDKKFPILGSYQARAINRLGRKTARNFSPIALVEGPSDPIIKVEPGNNAVFVDGKVELSLDATVDSHAYVTYHLYRSATENGEYEAKETSTLNKFAIEGAEYSELTPNADLGDGYYYIAVETRLNGVVTSKSGKPTRVTHPAKPVVITNSEPTYKVGNVVGYDVNKEFSITTAFHPSQGEDKRTEKDTLKYQWFKYVGPNGDKIKEDILAASKGEYKVSNLDVPIDKATGPSLKLDNTFDNEEGFYFCQVTNYYNYNKENENSKPAVKCSDFFDVIDTNVTE